MFAVGTLVLFLFSCRAAAVNSTCCDKIAAALPGVSLSLKSNQKGFTSSKALYWSVRQSEVSPQCFVTPSTTEQVSSIMKILSQPEHKNEPGCKFSIKSGGHMHFSGASNMPDGVTIDLVKLNQVTLSRDKRMVAVGPGNRWRDVFGKLEPEGVTVLGGRWATVGVGGLLTGGGLSFFSKRYGLAMDGIINHEVVLGNGTIVNANATSNADLHKALKGGSGNFGIVTRFDLNSWKQDKIWGGIMIHSPFQQKNSLKFLELVSQKSADPGVHILQAFTYAAGLWYGVTFAEYTLPFPGKVPEVFSGYYNDSLITTMSMQNVSNLAWQDALVAPDGFRQVFVTFTHVNSAAFMAKFIEMAGNTAAEINKRIWLMEYQVLNQPLPQVVTELSAKSGNSLGLEGNDKDLMISLVNVTWLNKKDDDFVIGLVKKLIDDATEAAKKAGVYHPFIYLNYAAEWQKPIDGYGARSKAQLRAASEKWDPQQIFQKQSTGGHKL